MPFTISHAAAALPFRRTRLIMPAVVIGCFAPDFEYFSPLGNHGTFGHTITGVFEFDLPASLAVLWLFQRFARDPLIACLPEGARARLYREPQASHLSVSRFALIVLSILVGVATHILWDGFTHRHYWIADHLHFLSSTVSVPVFGPRPWFGILQYFSSAFGMVIILFWCVHWYRNTSPSRSRQDGLTADRIAMACSVLIAVVFGFLRAYASGSPNGVHGAQRFMTEMAISGITILWIEIVIYGIVRHLSHRVKPAFK